MKDFVYGVGTPYQAPVDLLFAIAKVADTEAPYIPMCMSGWQHGAIADMESGDSFYELPNGFAAVWLSLTEKKVYEIDVDFSLQQKERLDKALRRGFVNKQGEKVTYTHFKVSFFPGGVVRIHLLGRNKILSMDDVFQGTETTGYDGGFLNQFGDHSKIRTIHDYCDIYERSGENGEALKKSAEFVTQIALPDGLWDRYYTRYDYDIRFAFENPKSYLYAWTSKFTDSESYSCLSGVNDPVNIGKLATMCSLNLWWRDDMFQYTSFFYFDEKEILPLFEKAFASHPEEKGELLVQVGKYNNSFELSLSIGHVRYLLKHTEIRVFRNLMTNQLGDGELFYKNYEGDHQNSFNGL